jgi:hypothetical protein
MKRFRLPDTPQIGLGFILVVGIIVIFFLVVSK